MARTSGAIENRRRVVRWRYQKTDVILEHGDNFVLLLLWNTTENMCLGSKSASKHYDIPKWEITTLTNTKRAIWHGARRLTFFKNTPHVYMVSAFESAINNEKLTNDGEEILSSVRVFFSQSVVIHAIFFFFFCNYSFSCYLVNIDFPMYKTLLMPVV